MLSKKQKELSQLIPKRKHIDQLFDYQQQCIDIIERLPEGSRSLVVMATGLGKTATFTSLPSHGGKTLIVAAGTEVVLNPAQYYDLEDVGVEMGEFHALRDFPDAKVVLASIDSLADRLEIYDPHEFYTVIIDEAHHAVAPTYKAVIDYFKPKRLLGFTATPNRSDGVSLSSVFDNIIFKRDLKWAIKNGKLSDICLTKVKIDVDLRNLKAKKNDGDSVADFSESEIAKVMASSAPVLRDIYKQYAFGPTIINVAGRALAYELANLIPGALAITGAMLPPEREVILDQFRKGKIPCLINVAVLKEGVDLPCTQTVIMARPTLSSLVYTQIVGRGLRIYSGKKFLNLVEVEGIVAPNVTLCSAPSLFGIDLSLIPEKDRDAFNKKRLTEMEELARDIIEAPQNWVLSQRNAKAWADTAGYDLHSVNWLMLPDGSFELSFPKNDARTLKENEKPGVYRMTLPPPDTLGRVTVGHTRFPFQIALDLAKLQLERNHKNKRVLWDKDEISKKWGKEPPSASQKWFIRSHVPEIDVDSLTKHQASEIIAKVKKKQEGEDESQITYIYPINPDIPPKHWTNVETVSVNGELFDLYDFDPGPSYLVDAKKKEVVANFAKWLQNIIQTGYRQCDGDINALIQRLNNSKREAYGFMFIRAHREYSYLCSLDASPTSRRDLMSWLAQVADQLLPCILYVDILHKDEGLNLQKVKPDLQNEPLCNLRFQFPDTEFMLSKTKNRKLPKLAEEIRREDMERWLEKERKKAKTKESERENSKKSPQKKVQKNSEKQKTASAASASSKTRKRGHPPKTPTSPF